MHRILIFNFLIYKIINIYLLNLLILSNKLPRVFKHYEKLHPISINRQDGTRVYVGLG